jgi:hypothetical protein
MQFFAENNIHKYVGMRFFLAIRDVLTYQDKNCLKKQKNNVFCSFILLSRLLIILRIA